MAIDTWIEIGTCMHCGGSIEGRPARAKSSITIAGLEPMEYRHKSDHTTICRQVIELKCVPYNQWNKRTEWEEKEKSIDKG